MKGIADRNCSSLKLWAFKHDKKKLEKSSVSISMVHIKTVMDQLRLEYPLCP